MQNKAALESLTLAQRMPREEHIFLSFLRRFLRVRMVPLSVAILAALIIIAVFARLIAPFDPDATSFRESLKNPSWQRFFGTDNLGRDTLSRVIHGARVSLTVGLISTIISAGLGAPLGVTAGYLMGRTDNLISRFLEVLQAFPSLVLAIAITAALGPSINNIMIALGVVLMPTNARLVRGEAISLSQRDFVEAARAIGATDLRIMVRHVWPGVVTPLIVVSTLNVAYAILTEASMSFLGLGIQPPNPSWGGMLKQGYNWMQQSAWISIFPGLAIMLAVLALNFLGDGLRDATDPRLRKQL